MCSRSQEHSRRSEMGGLECKNHRKHFHLNVFLTSLFARHAHPQFYKTHKHDAMMDGNNVDTSKNWNLPKGLSETLEQEMMNG